MIVVDDAYFTVCGISFDALFRLKPSPAYVAISERTPGVWNVSVHEPAAALAVHDVVPSLTVTLPVGAGPPCGLAETTKLIVTACPTFDGFGVWPVTDRLVV